MSVPKRTYTKPCDICGATFERPRYANGALQNSVEWSRRTWCGPQCHHEVRHRKYHKIYDGRKNAYQHPPCTHCGGPVKAREGEIRRAWRARVTCSPACRDARRRMSKGNPDTLQRGRPGKRSERKKIAPEGYVFNGRFPTPAGVTTWAPVSGPDTGVIATTRHNAVTVGRTTRRAIRAAVRGHPDLRDALLGQLSDSWVQQDNAG